MENMIKFNLTSFLVRSFYLQNKCRTIRKAISVSAVCHIRKETDDILYLKKNLTKLERSNYESTFGNIGGFESRFVNVNEDREDVLEYERERSASGESVQRYINMIQDLLKENDYKAAIKIFEDKVRNDKITNVRFIYNILLRYNASLGDLDEAYRLFIHYKQRQGIVTGAMYSSMFRACTNCNNSVLALKRANAIRDCLNKNKFHTVNIYNYNAMIKAYGRHGDLLTCLKIMDEILEKRGHVKEETYSCLLQACYADVNSGLRFALLIWRKMIKNKKKLSTHVFNIMLKCIKSCSLGEVLLIPDLIKQILEENKNLYKRKNKVEIIGTTVNCTSLKIPAEGSDLNVGTIENKLLPGGENKNLMVEYPNHSSNAENNSDLTESCMSTKKGEKSRDAPDITSLKNLDLPNLLALKPTTGSVVEFSRMATPQERFMLVGGVEGFLKTMAEFGAKPDIRTFTLLLGVIPANIEAEEKLISLAESYGIKFDTGFFNEVLRRRIYRYDNHLVENTLKQMYIRNLKPDILTFGILSMSCVTHESAIELLKNIRLHGFRVNTQIVDSLVVRAYIAKDMKYLNTVIRAAKEDDANLDSKCLAKISRAIRVEKYRKMLGEKHPGTFLTKS